MKNARRRRLYPILDTPVLERRGCGDWGMVANAMLEGGARILQFRHKGEWTRRTFARAEAIAEDCSRYGCELIVNDHADMAALLGAGVHVGQDDLAPMDVRRVAGDAVTVGFSTHNAEQLQAADREPVDYLAFGPVYQTSSKLNPDPVAGLAMLRCVREYTSKTLVAIGGITRERAAEVFAAGADTVAVISDLLPETLDHTSIRNRMEEWQLLTRR